MSFWCPISFVTNILYVFGEIVFCIHFLVDGMGIIYGTWSQITSLLVLAIIAEKNTKQQIWELFYKNL